MSYEVTLYQRINNTNISGERVGEFRKVPWCRTHGDWIGHMVPFDGRRCRWALKVDGTKPCADVVDRWMEVVG